MEVLQNQTDTKNKTDDKTASVVTPNPKELLKPQQLLYIDFCAVQGLVTEEDGTVKTMTASTFADKIGVVRQTLYEWQKSIPDFWSLVTQRRKEMGGNNRIQKVWNGVYLKAATGNPQAAALWLANFDPDFRMPTQPVKHGLDGGIADLLNKARERAREREQIVEGEVVNETNTNTGTS